MKLNLRAFDLNLLTVFDALMREQNLTRAAERVGMSQPAMSAALQRLRLSLKDELFVRHRSGMTPTPRAERVYLKVQPALQLITEGVSVGEVFDPATEDREFAIAVDSYIEVAALGSILCGLQAAGPMLRLRSENLIGVDVSAALNRLELDVVLDYLQVDSPRVDSEVLGTEELVVVAAADHPALAEGSCTMEAYLSCRHVLLRQRSAAASQLEQALGGARLDRQVALHVQDYAAMAAVVAQSRALGTMPRRLAHVYGRAHGLTVAPFPLDIAPVSLWMMWPRALSGDAGHRWFLDFLRQLAL